MTEQSGTGAGSGATPQQQHWETIYSTRKDTELSWYEAVPQGSLATVLALLPSRDSPIVDVGGGASRLVDGLLDAGCSAVSVLDLSAQALTLAKQRIGERAGCVAWLNCSVLEWRPTGRFQLWHDRAVYHFFTRPEDRATYAAAAGRALAAGGFLVLDTFAPDGPTSCSGLSVYRATEEEIAAQFAADFVLLRASGHEHVTPGGAVQRFQTRVLERR